MKRVLLDEGPGGLIVFHDPDTDTLGAFVRVHPTAVAAVTTPEGLADAFAKALLHLVHNERAAEVSPGGPTDEASPDEGARGEPTPHARRRQG
jgi:hypothetical protein